MADRQKPMGMDRALTSKMGAKYDPDAEREVKHWFQQLLNEDIGDGPNAVEKNLRNGIMLVKLMQKLFAGTSNLPPAAAKIGEPKYSTLETPFKQMENIEVFLKCARAYGVPPVSCFQTVDLYEGRNMPMVIATILQVGTEAQRNGFQGPAAGSKPTEKRKMKFSYEQLKSSQGVIGLQSGTNKFASQKGMKFGAVRHIADIRADQFSREGEGVITLQMGTNQHASQKGMRGFGAMRHIADVKADDLLREGTAYLRGDMGYTGGASQRGMTSFGAQRHVTDIKVTDLAESYLQQQNDEMSQSMEEED